MLSRIAALLLVSVGLVACAEQRGLPEPVLGRTRAPMSRIAILLPLSGPHADIGQSMLRAAQLALGTPPVPTAATPTPSAGSASGSGGTAQPPPGIPVLDVCDTAGTPEGAASAARLAIAKGATLILGPLTSAETASVAPVAHAARVSVLAFTNDATRARPGVWTLGITPLQQVRRLVEAARDEGKSRIAALLPPTDFGREMSAALQQTTTELSLPRPVIRYAQDQVAAITAVRELTNWDNWGGQINADVQTLREPDDPTTRQNTSDLAKTRPLPFDVLLLADTGQQLAELSSILSTRGVTPSSVRIVGPALWASHASGSARLQGAWYAAPDPSARAPFDQSYRSRYGIPAPPIADLAFDAASIGRVLAGSGGFSQANLLQKTGFSGADGLFLLEPDGQVRRSLAVFRIQSGPPLAVAGAPALIGVPGT